MAIRTVFFIELLLNVTYVQGGFLVMDRMALFSTKMCHDWWQLSCFEVWSLNFALSFTINASMSPCEKF